MGRPLPLAVMGREEGADQPHPREAEEEYLLLLSRSPSARCRATPKASSELLEQRGVEATPVARKLRSRAVGAARAPASKIRSFPNQKTSSANCRDGRPVRGLSPASSRVASRIREAGNFADEGRLVSPHRRGEVVLARDARMCNDTLRKMKCGAQVRGPA